MTGRVLGLDFGEKRIGVAISDPLGLTAQAQLYIPNTPQKWADIQALVSEYSIEKIVVGLPKNADGSDSKKASEVRAFGGELNQKTGVDVEYYDERYSTVAVQKHLIGADVSRKKRKEVVDSLAAQFFLQGYLDSNK